MLHFIHSEHFDDRKNSSENYVTMCDMKVSIPKHIQKIPNNP
jgi:hypothetical protein